MPEIHTVSDIVSWRMCLGCGACIWACKSGRIYLNDFVEEGIRPVVVPGDCGTCTDCLKVCPGFGCNYRKNMDARDYTFGDEFHRKWGPVLAIWEGHASDPEIRFRGASGGVLTALSLYCIEKKGMCGVLHTGALPEDPIRNKTRLSRSRPELLNACGSRYSPASVCDGLGLLERSPGPSAVIGRPVEIAAIENAVGLSPLLGEKVGLTMSFFCAETPSTRGTLELLRKVGMEKMDVAELRYRGHGWPGEFTVVRKGATEPSAGIPYRESWGFLQAYRPWAAQMWPDGGGELADITCGDPWYREPDGEDPGSSIVVARTQRGKALVEGAAAAGYLQLVLAEPWKLEKSQMGLLHKKGSVWGRRLALRSMNLPVGRLAGLHLFQCWLALPIMDKLKSILGTYRRVLGRRLRKPLST